MAQSDGGPAFPRPYSQLASGEQVWEQDGMSLRDWFAGQALSGFCASDGLIGHEGLAEDAYDVADRMFAARRPPESEGESDV